MKLFETCGIYKITSPSGRVYVGQSCNIGRRFKTYKRVHKNIEQPKLYKSLCKYGWKNHKFEIIEECAINELNEKERYWQDFYNVLSDNGLNMMLTETELNKRKLSEKTKKKISKSMKGRDPNNSLKVINIETNEIFKSIKECSRLMNLSYHNLKVTLRENRNTKYKYYEII